MEGATISRFHIHEDDLFEGLYPLLLGKVFHFTQSTNFNDINRCGYIDANKKGNLRSNSVHSHQSMGRHLGAVCLFDLRNKDLSDIGMGTIFHDFLTRRWRKDPSYFLILSSEHTSDLIQLKDIEEEIQRKAMYIPLVESWHPDNLPVCKLEAIYEVSLSRLKRTVGLPKET